MVPGFQVPHSKLIIMEAVPDILPVSQQFRHQELLTEAVRVQVRQFHQEDGPVLCQAVIPYAKGDRQLLHFSDLIAAAVLVHEEPELLRRASLCSAPVLVERGYLPGP